MDITDTHVLFCQYNAVDKSRHIALIINKFSIQEIIIIYSNHTVFNN